MWCNLSKGTSNSKSWASGTGRVSKERSQKIKNDALELGAGRVRG